jgi:transcriptional regulator with XRE-family HTH domain
MDNALQAQGLSARAFAALIDVQPAFLNKVMQGDRTVPLKRIEAWADALKLRGNDREQFLEAGFLTHTPPYICDLLQKLRANSER